MLAAEFTPNYDYRNLIALPACPDLHVITLSTYAMPRQWLNNNNRGCQPAAENTHPIPLVPGGGEPKPGSNSTLSGLEQHRDPQTRRLAEQRPRLFLYSTSGACIRVHCLFLNPGIMRPYQNANINGSSVPFLQWMQFFFTFSVAIFPHCTAHLNIFNSCSAQSAHEHLNTQTSTITKTPYLCASNKNNHA